MSVSLPWTDHAGRFSALKAATLGLVLLPGLHLAARWALHDLGARPVTELIHGTGDWTIRFLLLSLAVTPARAVLGWTRVVVLRRMLGVTAACYAGSHVLLYCMDQKWHLGVVASEIVLRFYLAIGFVTLTGLMVLAVTSTNAWQKRLGRRWKKLHRLVFLIAPLGLFHYFLQSKADVTPAVFAAGLFVWLMLWRLAPRRWQARVGLLPLLAVTAGISTALLEAGWYAAATRIPPLRVLAANLDVVYTLRPAPEVALAGAAVLLLAVLLRLRLARKTRAMVPTRAGAG
jgi:methionine sulfoxide reductase heme-binding subunit